MIIKKINLIWKEKFYKHFVRHYYYKKFDKVNLCSGPVILPGYWNVDINSNADIVLDMEKKLLPFPDDSMNVVVCISAINYFSKQRGQEIINDVNRILKKKGIARFATQDLRLISTKYVKKDKHFFFQKLKNGRDRFDGETFGEKFNSWFYGYESCGKKCKYVYDYETLSTLFKKAGFSKIKHVKYQESNLTDVKNIDNRPEQMFFLEAVK